MNSSGIKRGLATTAIAALAITGVPAIANAAPLDQAVDGSVVTLLAPTEAGVSANNDGTNNTYRLTALAGEDISTVTFSYQREGDENPTVIATVARNDNGVFATEWNPSNVAGGNVTLIAEGDDSTTETDLSTVADVLVNNNLRTTNVTNGDTIGVFQAPYVGNAGNDVIVSGTSSAPNSAPVLSFYNQAADEFQGNATAQPTTAPNASTGTWSGVLDITGYPFDATDNQLLVQAVDGTADTEAFDLYRQTITTVTATTEDTSANGAEVTVTVVDQNGAPISGARVVSSADQDDVDFTDANGEAQFTQTDATAYYYADATDAPGYQAGLNDKRSADVTFEQYVPVATSLEVESDNGNAFTYNEYDTNDITVQVQDQRGADVEGVQEVRYYWTFTSFDGDTVFRDPATGTNQDFTNTDGLADIELPDVPTETRVDEDGEIIRDADGDPVQFNVGGTYTLFAGVAADDTTGDGAVPVSNVLSVKVGDGEVDFDGSDPLTGPGGGEIAVSGSVQLEDGTALPGRPVLLTYVPSAGGNAAFDQAAGPDTVTRRVVADAQGNFSAVLDDPAVATGTQPTETGTINATSLNYIEADDDTTADPDTDNAGATGSVDVVFSQATPPANSTVVIGGEIAAANQEATPGEAVSGSVTVTSPDTNNDGNREVVANQSVTLTVDGDSFFTNGEQVTTTEGAELGELENLGKTITVTTSSTGVASFQVTVARSTEFDDDGEAEDIVTATAGTATDTEDVDYSTEGPLNGGEVSVELANDADQDSGVLPLAPITDDVAYDVNVTDQFGNPVGDEPVDIDIDGVGDVIGAGADSAVTTDFDDRADFYVSSDVAGESTPVATWDAPVNVVDNEAPAADDTREIEGEGDTVTFYTVDFANSTFTLSQQGAENVPVGSTVIMTYTAIDQNGEPIELDDVDFLRVGPGNAQDDASDGDNNETGEDGKVNYVFQGATAGTANVTAIGYIGGEVIPESQASDTVTFGGGTGPETLRPKLSANNNGAKADRLNLTTGKAIAEGAVAKFFRIKADGSSVQVGRGVLNENGQVKVNVKDVNGKKFTRYFAKIMKTEDTKFAKSKNTRVR